MLEGAHEHDFLLLEDRAYRATAEPGRDLPTLRALDEQGRVAYLGTFAKACYRWTPSSIWSVWR